MTEFQSLVRLLDDDTPQVRENVAAKLKEYGGDVSEALAECAHPLTDQEKNLLSELLRPCRREQLLREWYVPAGGWQGMEDDWEGLEGCLRQLSDYLHDGVTLRPSLSDAIDILAQEAEVVVNELEAEGLRIHLFESGKLRGNHEDFHDPRNADLVWCLDEGKSNPIGLSLIFLLVARRLDLDAEGVNFPGHFLCRIENGGEVLMVDCFNAGRLHNLREILARHDVIEAGIADSLLAIATPGEMLLRVLRNLELSFQKTGKTEDAELIKKLVHSIGG